MANVITRIWSEYKDESPATVFHVIGRAVACPFLRLLPYFPESGKILDIGCGHGVLLNLLACDSANRGRRLTGIDHALNKIEIAARCAADPDMRFSTTSLESFPDGEFDAVSIVDVMCTIGMDKWKGIFDNCFRILKPEGRLILKETITRPLWKYWLIMLEEIIAIELVKITKGESPHIESVETHRKWLGKSGFDIVEEKPVNTIHWASQYLFIARKAGLSGKRIGDGTR